jgi:hypothetical protein
MAQETIHSMVLIEEGKVTGERIADVYKIATTIYKKTYDARLSAELQRDGLQMLGLSGIEASMDNLKFCADASRGMVHFWVSIKGHGENYITKEQQFEKAVENYFA